VLDDHLAVVDRAEDVFAETAVAEATLAKDERYLARVTRL